MIAAISSSDASFEETLNTLKYANRAKAIRSHLQRNVLNVNYHISEYVNLIDKLRTEIKALKDQIGGSGPSRTVSSSGLSFGLSDGHSQRTATLLTSSVSRRASNPTGQLSYRAGDLPYELTD
jgi:hypothetical protein